MTEIKEKTARVFDPQRNYDEFAAIHGFDLRTHEVKIEKRIAYLGLLDNRDPEAVGSAYLKARNLS